MSEGDSSHDLGLAPISRPKLYEVVAARLEAAIRDGRLRPGDRLPSERDLMETFETGRPSVREAFLFLEKKGLIETENGRRARVKKPDVGSVLESLDSVIHLSLQDGETFKDLFAARSFLEQAMARNAAKSITDAQLALLRERLELNGRAIGDRHEFVRTDALFHRTLFEVADNRIFEAVHDAFAGWVEERRSKLQRESFTEQHAHRQHIDIFNAIAAHDPEAAETAMRDHLKGWWAAWVTQKELPQEAYADPPNGRD
ncbi:MAG: FCD domain-containing protein [Devosia sp.]|jgi:DNA-binding FadR family transcriptional regulator|nr:FCD domain-containing protein [Devosia sp.]